MPKALVVHTRKGRRHNAMGARWQAQLSLRRLRRRAVDRDSGMGFEGEFEGDFDSAVEHRADMRKDARLALLADHGDGIATCILDAMGHVTAWNRGAKAVLGWEEADVLGRHFSIFHPPTQGAKGWLARMLDKVAGDDAAEAGGAFEPGDLGRPPLASAPFEAEVLHVRRDGSMIPARVSIAGLRNLSGELVGFGYVVRNLTALRAAESAVESREMQMRAILKTLPDAMIVIDELGVVREFSAAAEHMFGYGRDEVVGANVSMLMPAPDHDAHDAHLLRYRETGERHMIGTRRRTYGLRRDGTMFPIDLVVGEASGGGIRLFTAIVHDRTAQEQADMQMQSLQSELLHVSRVSAMGTMAATLAHELNQPITAVANYVETCIEMLETPEAQALRSVREALVEAASQALRAGEIISRLRRFVARGDTDKTIETVAGLIEEGCGLGLSGARERGIRRRIVLDPTAGPVLVDRVQINQVLVNLLRNAMEAIGQQAAGQITISARRDGDFARILVEDSGTGVPPELLGGLFNAFVSSKRDGMGLGLSICRTIVEAHGGRIWAEDGENGGTAFHFTLPRVRIEEFENDGD